MTPLGTMASEEFKLCVVGPEASGKTCLVQRLTKGDFVDQDDSTLEDTVRHSLVVDGISTALDILDTGGSPTYSHMHPNWFKDKDAFLIVFSLGDASGLRSVKALLPAIRKYKNRNFLGCLVGTQLDGKRLLTKEDGASVAYEFGMSYHETSAMTGENVNELFHDVVLEMRNGRVEHAVHHRAAGHTEKSSKKDKKKKKDKAARSLGGGSPETPRHRSGLGGLLGHRSKQKKEEQRELEMENSLSIVTDPALRRELRELVPTLKVKPLRGKTELTNIRGPVYPDAREDAIAKAVPEEKRSGPSPVLNVDPALEESLHPQMQNYEDRVSCRGVSTYPLTEGASGVRMGDPICDQYAFALFGNRCLMTLADGCNWGVQVAAAARIAADAMLDYQKRHMRECSTLRDAVMLMLRGFNVAHSRIIEGRDEETMFQAGTTTIISSMFFELDDSESERWAVVALSVGDCKMLRLSSKTGKISDLTEGNRCNLNDARDPGGRIGPYKDGGAPDLRNIMSYWRALDEGDIIMLCSDGVHDNVDPQQLGLLPKDIGIVGFDAWDQIDFPGEIQLESDSRADEAAMTQILRDKELNDARSVRDKWVEDKMNSLVATLGEDPSPEDLVQLFCSHAQDCTKSSRDFMQENPDMSLPKDYTKFPGKMDHTTMTAFRIGRAGSADDDAVEDEPSLMAGLGSMVAGAIGIAAGSSFSAESDLGEWEERRDDSSNSLFFYNTESGAVTWADPRKNHPSGWSKYYDDDDEPYYHNSKSGETSWDIPEILRKKK